VESLKRIGFPSGGTHIWFSAENDKLEEDFQKVRKLVLEVAIAYLEKFYSIEKLLVACENAEVQKRRAL
jgi:hypothetical protein